MTCSRCRSSPPSSPTTQRCWMSACLARCCRARSTSHEESPDAHTQVAVGGHGAVAYGVPGQLDRDSTGRRDSLTGGGRGRCVGDPHWTRCRRVRAAQSPRPSPTRSSRSPTTVRLPAVAHCSAASFRMARIWNPGANDATAITLSRAVTINGNRLDAGKYSIWAIPGEREWTVIFSRAADVFHQPYPGEEHDALRLTICPDAGRLRGNARVLLSGCRKKGCGAPPTLGGDDRTVRHHGTVGVL